jgi:hypothetical protein
MALAIAVLSALLPLAEGYNAEERLPLEQCTGDMGETREDVKHVHKHRERLPQMTVQLLEAVQAVHQKA